MKVVLYRVGRNLNRAYRTAEAFGVSDIILVQCNTEIKGGLFRAKGRVAIQKADVLQTKGALALETFYKDQLNSVDWSTVKYIIIGGETSGLPHSVRFEQAATIPMVGKVSGLTVEAALAIALYEWRQNYDTYTRT